MARKDGTGPMGQGALTGRGLGPCSGSDSAGYGVGGRRGAGRMARVGMGIGLGMACSRGLGRFFSGRRQSADDRGMLENQKQILQSRINAIDDMLKESEGDNE